MSVFDSHIHFGQFYDICTTPKELLDYLNSVGVAVFAASSTSICEGDYDKVIAEMQELVEAGGSKIYPVLWVLPQMLEDGGLEKFMDSGINWKCVKIHPQLHPTKWLADERCIVSVCRFASTLLVPLLIHTGEMSGCYPKQFEHVIKRFPNLVFILAHGRPIEQTVSLMKAYQNVWTDTAFMPINNVVRLCDEKLSDRVLWGTDYPIPKFFFKDLDMKTYYQDLLLELHNSVSESDYDKITKNNFQKSFK